VGAETQEIVAISVHGVVIRIPVQDVKFLHRGARGVQLMRVTAREQVVALASLGEDDTELEPEPEALNGAGEGAVALAGDVVAALNGSSTGEDEDEDEDDPDVDGFAGGDDEDDGGDDEDDGAAGEDEA